MLEQIIDNIIRKIRQEVIQPGMKDVPLNYLLTRNIPDSVKHFFDQEVELWLREEAEKFTSGDRFNYEIPEVQVLVDKIFDILKQTATFHIHQFNRLLERAIKLQANYLIRPHQTLTQFLFKDSFVITTIEVYDMLKYFDKFQYYKDALTDYFNLKYLREISQTQFEELIKGIDLQVFSRAPIDTALQTIKTINEFLDEGRTTSSDKIETRILSMIFRDRNLTEFAELVERELNDGHQELSLSELEQILRTGKSLRQVQEERRAEVSVIDQLADIEAARPEVEVETIAVPEEIEPPAPEEPEEEEEEEEEEAYADTAYDEQADTATHITAAEHLAQVVSEKMKGDHLEDLRKLITPKQRKRFIKKIFRKQEQRYEEFIDLLNNTPTWKSATNLIDNFFYQEGINPYSKEALEFSDLAYNRYFPRDISVNKGEEFRY